MEHLDNNASISQGITSTNQEKRVLSCIRHNYLSNATTGQKSAGGMRRRSDIYVEMSRWSLTRRDTTEPYGRSLQLSHGQDPLLQSIAPCPAAPQPQELSGSCIPPSCGNSLSIPCMELIRFKGFSGLKLSVKQPEGKHGLCMLGCPWRNLCRR